MNTYKVWLKNIITVEAESEAEAKREFMDAYNLCVNESEIGCDNLSEYDDEEGSE